MVRFLTWSPYVVFLDKIACRSYGLFLGCGLPLMPYRVKAWLHVIHPVARAVCIFAGVASITVLGKAGYLASTLGVSFEPTAVVALAIPDRTIGSGLTAVALRWIGARSYALYLCHMPVLHLPGYAFGVAGFAAERHGVPTTVTAFALVAAFASSCLAAHLTFKYVETPFMKRAARDNLVPKSGS